MVSENRGSDFERSEKRVEELQRLSTDELGRRLYHAKLHAGTRNPEGLTAAIEASRIQQAIERKRKTREKALNARFLN